MSEYTPIQSHHNRGGIYNRFSNRFPRYHLIYRSNRIEKNLYNSNGGNVDDDIYFIKYVEKVLYKYDNYNVGIK